MKPQKSKKTENFKIGDYVYITTNLSVLEGCIWDINKDGWIAVEYKDGDVDLSYWDPQSVFFTHSKIKAFIAWKKKK